MISGALAKSRRSLGSVFRRIRSARGVSSGDSGIRAKCGEENAYMARMAPTRVGGRQRTVVRGPVESWRSPASADARILGGWRRWAGRGAHKSAGGRGCVGREKAAKAPVTLSRISENSRSSDCALERPPPHPPPTPTRESHN